MKLSTFKQHLNRVNAVNFVQPNGHFVPRHFHITEAGLVTKHFIDCGGTVRQEKAINFQVWVANDTDHRLAPQKLLNIISLSEKLFGNEDLEIEVEYQSDTIGKYGLDFQGENFLLTAKQTDCLAKDNCGIPQDLQVSALETTNSCCTPGGGCC
ncbi:MAG: hypothetical protein IPN22_12965 [Bacteroidetes bacterium]|nr:hypothetical protein [Bacteroidota bacterium]